MQFIFAFSCITCHLKRDVFVITFFIFQDTHSFQTSFCNQRPVSFFIFLFTFLLDDHHDDREENRDVRQSFVQQITCHSKKSSRDFVFCSCCSLVSRKSKREKDEMKMKQDIAWPRRTCRLLLSSSWSSGRSWGSSSLFYLSIDFPNKNGSHDAKNGFEEREREGEKM